MIEIIRQERVNTLGDGVTGGKVNIITEYAITEDDEIKQLEKAGVGSSAVCKTGKIFYKFPDGWQEM